MPAPKETLVATEADIPKKVKMADTDQNDLLPYLAAQMLNSEDRNKFFARLQNRYSQDDTLNQGIVNRAIYSRAGDTTGSIFITHPPKTSTQKQKIQYLQNMQQLPLTLENSTCKDLLQVELNHQQLTLIIQIFFQSPFRLFLAISISAFT